MRCHSSQLTHSFWGIQQVIQRTYFQASLTKDPGIEDPSYYWVSQCTTCFLLCRLICSASSQARLKTYSLSKPEPGSEIHHMKCSCHRGWGESGFKFEECIWRSYEHQSYLFCCGQGLTARLSCWALSSILRSWSGHRQSSFQADTNGSNWWWF